MPNTLIRAGYLDSDRISALSDFDDRVFFRLLLIADDAGRTDGRADKLRSALFPTRQNVRVNDIEKSIASIIQASLVTRWEVEGKPVIQILRWQRRSGAQYSKYPDPQGRFHIEWIDRESPDGKISFCSTSILNPSSGVQQPIANPSPTHQGGQQKIHGDEDGDGDGDDNTSPAGEGCEGSAKPSMDDLVLEIYQAYPRKVDRKDALRAIKKALLAIGHEGKDPSWMLDRVKAYAKLMALEKKEPRFIPHPSTWFNKGRYNEPDDPKEQLNLPIVSEASNLPQVKPQLSVEEAEAERMKAILGLDLHEMNRKGEEERQRILRLRAEGKEI